MSTSSQHSQTDYGQITLEPGEISTIESHIQDSDQYQIAPVTSEEGIEAYLVEDNEAGVVHYVERGSQGVTEDGSFSFDYITVDASIEEVASELENSSNEKSTMHEIAERADEHPMRDPSPSNQDIVTAKDEEITGWGYADSDLRLN